ncbi:MAG: hypothetical protein KJ607_11570, partial [Bacteroidetes bacterium]|nr:hypothetical protein [Bacteroidota bacterium]
MKTRLLVLAVSFCLAIGCSKEDSPEFEDIPVIEAYLKTGDILKVAIRRQEPFDADARYAEEDIDALSLVIMYDKTVRTLVSVGDGMYVDSAVVITAGVEYTLT